VAATAASSVLGYEEDHLRNLKRKSTKTSKSANWKRDDTIDVCVVGGGPAGVYAAYLLEGKGYNVTLFEKDSVVGGKTVPRKNPDGTENVRHIYIAPAMKTIQRIIDYLGYSDAGVPLPLRNIYTALGQIIPAGEASPSVESLLALNEFVNLTAPGTPIYPFAVADTNENLPPELTVPFGEWLTANNISEVTPLLYNIITNYGYDFIERLPAIYILHYLVFGTFPTAPWRVFPFHTVIQELANDLNDVRTNSEITSIKVKKDTYSKIVVDGEKDTVKCEKTIIAFPQTKDAMDIVKGLSKTAKIFDMVKYVRYYELAIENEELAPGVIAGSTSYVQAPQPGTVNDEPSIYLRYLDSGVVTVLFNSGYVTRSEAEVIDRVKDHIAKLWHIDVPVEDIDFFKEHTYFPHVSSEDVEAFYDGSAEIQGQSNIFFTGALFNFELVDKAMQHAEYIVDTFFP
jgi:hypothetical protein